MRKPNLYKRHKRDTCCSERDTTPWEGLKRSLKICREQCETKYINKGKKKEKKPEEKTVEEETGNGLDPGQERSPDQGVDFPMIERYQLK